ncbi:ABC transporter ATP-binding protein [Hyphomonas johnsonii]|uniref:ABC transporter-like protein n=1 Tax=Hyphomonas johnsonii MHS-2 TaxID=1280950 RepID=A0A059FAE9_9PROT|nr:ABC transporter ATP-binding protein [Hyphomonas johnsonii]KCZ87590.1 ABC transporter-like protein [Hyphomonas johnsonii MHS-2]
MAILMDESTARTPPVDLGGAHQGAALIADKIGIVFPARGPVVHEAEITGDDRMVWTSRGRLKGIRALEDISFSLRQGDRLAIVGRNGSGKTTLLQVLAGILSPVSGQLTTTGRVTSLININLGIQPEATGHRNITLRGLAAGYSHKAIEAKRAEIMEFSELGEFLDLPLEAYSSGMRMRLTFSIATAFEPEILILDEWLSAGDVSFKKKATGRMREFVSKAGILVLASHSRKLIQDNCDTAIWLDNGRIREFGPAEQVVNAYEADQKQTKDDPGTLAGAA